MADETVPIFTINDFPTEIIERFTPNLRPRTVSTLRLVSKRFRDVFSADRYYRSYLCYSDRVELYRRDLEGIGDDEGRWKRCLEAEKLRLDNWRNGRNTRVDTVKIPSDIIPVSWGMYEELSFKWQGKTGEEHEHWMLSEILHQRIVLLNVTRDPILTVVDVSSFTSKPANFAVLLPDQVMIDSGTGSKHVFNIVNDGNKLSLEYLFTIEVNTLETGLSISGKSDVSRTYRSLYVSCEDEPTDINGVRRYPTDVVLRVWDLKRGVGLENIVLSELLLPKRISDFGFLCIVGDIIFEFPHVMLVLLFEEDDVEQEVVAIVNVDERRLVLWLGDLKGLQLGSHTLKGNTVCMILLDYDLLKMTLRVYDLRIRITLETGKSDHLFEYIDHIRPSINYHYEPPMLFVYDKVLNKTQVVCIEGTDISQREISFEDCKQLFPVDFVIGPFFICKNRCSISGSQRLTAFNMFGKLMFDWFELMPGNFSFNINRVSTCHYTDIVKGVDFNSLLKCVFVNLRGDNLYICYF